jgi:hypothetical protein
LCYTLTLAPCLLLTGPSARAGSYGSPQYSGGQYTYASEYPGYNPPPANYGSVSGGYGYSGSNSSGTTSCSGAIKTAFAYTPATGLNVTSDPPPQNVIVVETSTASVSVAASNFGSAPGCSGGLDTGIGPSQSPIPITPTQKVQNGQTYYTANGSVSLTHTRYEVKPGALPFTLSASPMATATGTNGSGGSSSIGVSYSAAAYPVTITVSVAGGTASTAAQQALAGQQIQATCNYSGPGTVAYQWSATGASSPNPIKN